MPGRAAPHHCRAPTTNTPMFVGSFIHRCADVRVHEQRVAWVLEVLPQAATEPDYRTGPQKYERQRQEYQPHKEAARAGLVAPLQVRGRRVRRRVSCELTPSCLPTEVPLFLLPLPPLVLFLYCFFVVVTLQPSRVSMGHRKGSTKYKHNTERFYVLDRRAPRDALLFHLVRHRVPPMV